ncbi:MAG: hypothetical protein REI95_14035 [Oxalicibacterium faecigallinarum]|uniref:hypothetical protein n=1 Tax=Oxalicibacterium faecigallinarum TaxID=573741 RepID=UPI0028074750|nr:hypothetical protein [Oxalicibacterium faecigallinarum]MDQ7970749.1 hypothetical protein [Oxalicibacterium faecigallinarum]
MKNKVTAKADFLHGGISALLGQEVIGLSNSAIKDLEAAGLIGVELVDGDSEEVVEDDSSKALAAEKFRLKEEYALALKQGLEEEKTKLVEIAKTEVEAEKLRLAEESAAALEVEKARLAEESANAIEVEKKRLAEESAKELEAEKKRLAKATEKKAADPANKMASDPSNKQEN